MEMLKKISYILTGKQKRRMIILFLLILVGAVVELIGVAAILPIANVASSPESIDNVEYLKRLYDISGMSSAETFLIFLCYLLILIYLAKNLFLIFMRHMQNVYMNNNQFRLSRELTEYYVNQPYLYHVNHNRAEIIRNISNDSNMFFQALSALIQLITDVVICLTLFIYLLISDIEMTLITVLVLAMFMLFFVKFTRKKIAYYGKKYREYANTMGNKLYQMFGGIKEIKVLEREAYFTSSYYREYDNNIKYIKRYKFVSLLPSPVAESIIICGLLGVIIWKIFSGTNMQSLVPTLAVFAVAAFRMLPSINRITNQINALTYNKVAVDAVYEAIKRSREDKADDRKAGKTAEADILAFEKEIKVEGLTFVYPGREEKVLDNVNLVIPKNSSVAFIGPSGAGKTTLADIILNVLEPVKGRILCDGLDITKNCRQWHQKIGYIPQTVFLLDDTIRNNIAFGIPEKEIDDKKIMDAIQRAQLLEFVGSLGDGIDTSIGECGSRLSGGQRQRLGIARALYSDPEILIMDEATSALDNETENAVMEAIETFSGQKTLIIIAHRLTTIRNCDIVYEVKEGKVTRKKQMERKEYENNQENM